MRLSVAAAARVAAAAAFTACANLGSPPGGPVRTEPPVLESTTPDSGAINFSDDAVVFQFDAVVSDRDIENQFLISPREGTPRVRWRRSRVEVRPGRPFRPNTAYAVTLLPGITDLNSNRLASGHTIVFSTGPTIPTLTIQGRVFDWVTERPAPNARVEATLLPDSLPYVAIADSVGQFTIGPLGDGNYQVRALIDMNRNRDLDSGEAWDSASVVVRGGSPVLEMLAVARDTVPPRLLIVMATDSVTVVAGFDRPLDPTQSFETAFVVQKPDSTRLRVVRVQTRAQRDSAIRARADSAVPDSVRRPDPRVEALTARLPGQPAAARPSRRAPPQELTLTLDPATPMQRNVSYRVTATGVRGVNGRVRESDRVIQGPVPRDTTTPPLTRPPLESAVGVRRQSPPSQR